MGRPADEGALPDGLRVWRRVHRAWLVEKEGRTRLASLAFKDRGTGRVSLYRADLRDLAVVREQFPGQGIVELRVKDVRDVGCDVIPDPTPDDPSHVVIVPHPTARGSKSLAERADQAWIVPLEDCRS